MQVSVSGFLSWRHHVPGPRPVTTGSTPSPFGLSMPTVPNCQAWLASAPEDCGGSYSRGNHSGHGAPSRSDGAAAERRWADTMGEAHPPTVSERQRRNRAATKAAGTGPEGRRGGAPEQLPPSGGGRIQWAKPIRPRFRSGSDENELRQRQRGQARRAAGAVPLRSCG